MMKNKIQTNSLSTVVKNLILDVLFPKFCLNCQKEGDYLCYDCFNLIEIFDRQYCPFCFPPKTVIDGKTCIYCRKNKNLTGLYCASSFDNFIIKKLIYYFKYRPHYLKELSEILAFIILCHFSKLKIGKENALPFLGANKENFVIIPAPLYKNKIKKRGFNQAEEIAKHLSFKLEIPYLRDILYKIKKTLNQADLKKEERIKNIYGAFDIKKPELIKNKKILLTDDVFTTGATLEECARILKLSGAKEVWGITVARG